LLFSTPFAGLLNQLKFGNEIIKAAIEHNATQISMNDLAVYSKCLPTLIAGTSVICQTTQEVQKLYVLSILQELYQSNEVTPTALICCHTRSRAYEVHQLVKDLSKYLSKINSILLVGHADIAAQRKVMKQTKFQIVVGTPGRILELCEEKSLSLNNIRHFVIDGADTAFEWLDMRRDVQSIILKSPKKKQIIALLRKPSKTASEVCSKLIKAADQEPFEYNQPQIVVAKQEEEEEIDILS